MKLLLDTHAVIWWVDQYGLLSPTAHNAIADPNNELVVSAATIWEIAIKVGIGKLKLSQPYRTWMNQVIADLRATTLPITVQYADVQANLPQLHGDPFDRLLVAQSLTEQIPLISNDVMFDDYGVNRFW